MKNLTAILLPLAIAGEAAALNLQSIPKSRDEISEELVLSQMSRSFPSCEFRSWGPALVFKFGPLRKHFEKKAVVQREFDETRMLIITVMDAAPILKREATDLHPFLRFKDEREKLDALVKDALTSLLTVKSHQDLLDQVGAFGSRLAKMKTELESLRREEERLATLIDQKTTFTDEMESLRLRYQKSEPGLSLDAEIKETSLQLEALGQADQVTQLRESFFQRLSDERELARQDRHERERRLERVDRESLDLVLGHFYQLAKLRLGDHKLLRNFQNEVTRISLSTKLGTDDLDRLAAYLYFEYRLAQRYRGALDADEPSLGDALAYRFEMNLNFLRNLLVGKARAQDLKVIRVARRTSHFFRKASLFKGLLGEDLKIEKDLGAREREILVAGALSHLELYTSMVVAAQNLSAPTVPIAPAAFDQKEPRRPADPPRRVSSYSERDRIRAEWSSYRDAVNRFRKRAEEYSAGIKKFKNVVWPQYQREVTEYRKLLAKKQKALQVVGFYLLSQVPALGRESVQVQRVLADKAAQVETALVQLQPKQTAASLTSLRQRPNYHPPSPATGGDAGATDFFWWWYFSSQHGDWADNHDRGVQESFGAFPGIEAEAWDAVGVSQAVGTGWMPPEVPDLGHETSAMHEDAASLESLDLPDLYLDVPSLNEFIDPEMPDMNFEMPDLPDLPDVSMPDMVDVAVDVSVDVGSDAGDAGDGGGGDGGGGD